MLPQPHLKGDSAVKPETVLRYVAVIIKVKETLARTVFEGYATSHRLKWDSLPQDEVDWIAQHVMGKEARKGWTNSLGNSKPHI